MKVLTIYSLVFVLGFYALDCSGGKKNGAPKNDAPPPPKTFPLGEYQYTGYDEGGAKVVEGRLSITSRKGDELKGTWELKQTGGPQRIGPQVGSGDLVGSVHGTEVALNLNPNINDDNVNLRGKVEGKSYKGTWSYSGFAGVISSGRFEATAR
ncbi:MAG TPA: hypothetical protein VN256_20405 [Pyrinomonadaceae bacterium]|nr:hypothetical protein [Pyrinomonadaceae bacterium]